MRLTALVAAFALCGMGCASTYRPQEPGRISFVLEGGLALYRDGTKYSAGGLSSDPIRAVAGNPAAEQHARTYVGRSRLFWSIYAVALGCLVTGLVVHGKAPSSRVDDGLLIAGFAGILVSPFVAATTPPHLYDAVNTYNDGLAKPGR